MNAFEAIATAQTSSGANVTFYLYAAAYNGNIYRFIAYTFSEQFDAFESEFIRTTNNFQPLNDPSILNIDPVRLNAYRANRTAPFRSFLPEDLPMDITPQEVAIANQTPLGETIEAGTWIKIPYQ